MNAPETQTVPTTGPLRGSVRPPGSKSITNRALLCAALAAGRSQLHGALTSEDTRVMIAALRQLGVEVRDREGVLEVNGCGGQLPQRTADLYVANSGTTLRFLTAALAATGGNYRLDGIERMRARPVKDLLDALQQLGGHAHSECGTGCPPVKIESTGLRGGRATVRGNISSQFLSGLLMAAPLAQQAVLLEVDGPLVSQPYVSMTLRVMQAFGIALDDSVGDPHAKCFAIQAPQLYRAARYVIEP